MKKTTTKLQLKKNTIRLLQNSQLVEVHGGAPTNQGQMCSGTCDPPGHTKRHCC